MPGSWPDIKALYAELKDDHWTVTDASFWLAVTLLVLMLVVVLLGR